MFGKRVRVVFAILWGVLTLPAGFLAALLWGLMRMDAGLIAPQPQLVALWILPFILFISCIGEVMATQGEDSAGKRLQAKVFAALPLLNVFVIVVLILLRSGN